MEVIKSRIRRVNRGRNGSDFIYEFEKCRTLRAINRIVLAKIIIKESRRIGSEIKCEEIVIKFHSMTKVEEELRK